VATIFMRMDTNRLPKQALQYKWKGRRNIGRPRKRWRDEHYLEDQGTGNTPNPSGTWWWWWWWWWWWVYFETMFVVVVWDMTPCILEDTFAVRFATHVPNHQMSCCRKLYFDSQILGTQKFWAQYIYSQRIANMYWVQLDMWYAKDRSDS